MLAFARPMDPREMDSLVQRLVQNPHDQDAITYAHQAGQSDPRSYAMLLEKTGTATADPSLASHWLTEAANVWSTTLGDAHRAARALMIAIDRDPTQPTPAERLADLYREKGDTKALAALLERRAKALAPLAQHDHEMRAHIAGIHEELGRLWSEAPLSQVRKAVENYRKAIEYDSQSQYAIYGARELLKAQQQWAEAIPFFQMEQDLVDDVERKLALYQDEAEVRKAAGDLAGAVDVLRMARSVEGGQDPGLMQQLGAAILDRVQAGEPVADQEKQEAADLFVALAETYSGEHGLSYSECALDVEPGNDRAIQLALYYSAELGRQAEVVRLAAGYLKANPSGALAADARSVVAQYAGADGQVDDAILESLEPPAEASDPERAAGLLELADALVKKGKKQQAAAKYKEALQYDPGNEEALTFLESYLRQTRKYAELRDVLLAATRAADVLDDQRKAWLREIAGLCESQLRDLDTAIQVLKQLLQMEPGDEGIQSQLRRLLERGGRWDDLATLLEQEAEQTPDIEARLTIEKNLAKLHEVKRRDPVGAGEAWARIASLTPDDETAIQTAVRHFERGERPDLAAQVIADNVGSVQDERAQPHLYKKLGDLRQAAGDLLAAGEAYGEGAAVKGDPHLWEAAETCFVSAEAWDQAARAVDERATLATRDRDKAALHAKGAEYLRRADDEASAVLRLEQAADLDPTNAEYADALEGAYEGSERFADLAAYLLRRADKIQDKELRIELRKRAAKLQRETLEDADAARESLEQVLLDGEDVEALAALADAAQERGENEEAVDFLKRLAAATPEKAERARILLREAELIADGLDDAEQAIERYEAVLAEIDPKNEPALRRIADLHERRDDPAGTAKALERLVAIVEGTEDKIEIAQRLAALYEGPLDDAKSAIAALDVVREADPEDFEAVQRLCDLAEKIEDWPRYAEHLSQLVEVEGDEAEISSMTRRLADVLYRECDRGDEALAALMKVADEGDEDCREEYVKLGDSLGWKGIVAQKLVEWFEEAPPGDARHEALRGAFARFVEVGRESDAATVAKELARTRGADKEIAEQLEEIGVKLKDLDALGAAHDLLVADLSGPSRAEEMVRQAEVLARAGVDPVEAIQHGEQAMTSVSPDAVEPLLARLGALAEAPGHVIDLYERQIGRCKAPADRHRALARAAQVAAAKDALDRARGFFDIALGGGVQEDTLEVLEQVARDGDAERESNKLRNTLAEALAAGGQGSRDGGRTRSAMLRRAALVAFRDLSDADRAFGWLGDALVTHVDDAGLDTLQEVSDEVGDPKRAEGVLARALEEVFDGPLVRKLLARRARLRRDQLDDKRGAAEDLKRLHDLSPSDTDVMDELSALYKELDDYRGMVQLFEDQILRGRDAASRVELARKVARLWEERLADPREAADAWRRVLRMKSGDPEAAEGLERAKQNMLKAPKSEPPPPPPQEQTPSPPAAAAEPTPSPAPAQPTPSPTAAAASPVPAQARTRRSRPPIPPSSRPKPRSNPTPGAPADDDRPTVPPDSAARDDLEEQTVTDPQATFEALMADRQGGDGVDVFDAETTDPAAAASDGPTLADERPSDSTEIRPPMAMGADDTDQDAEEVDDAELLVDDDDLLVEDDDAS